jgi:hypothetical protein
MKLQVAKSKIRHQFLKSRALEPQGIKGLYPDMFIIYLEYCPFRFLFQGSIDNEPLHPQTPEGKLTREKPPW